MNKNRKKKYRVEKPGGGFDYVSSSSEFYSSGPVQKPLSDDRAPSDAHAVRRTARHQIAAGREMGKMDPREKMALMAILKALILIISLGIAFFMLRKGIQLYEESIWIENASESEISPVLQEVELVQEFDIGNQDSREMFASRVAIWKEAERLVSTADMLLRRNLYDEAIRQCQDALRLDPAHLGALERLGQLYYAKGSYVEAINAYVRLLSVDPSREKTQQNLIQALDAFGDFKAVKYMAEWYLEENIYDVEIQRYLARAYHALEEFELSAEAYGQVLRESPTDLGALEQQADAYMQLGQYEKAMESLEKLRQSNLRNPVYHRQLATCNAQLGRGQETVQVLVRATQIFGPQMVLGLIQDPQLDPVREDRAFQAFVDRIGGPDFRLGIEEMARRTAEMESAKPQEELSIILPGEEQ